MQRHPGLGGRSRLLTRQDVLWRGAVARKNQINTGTPPLRRARFIRGHLGFRASLTHSCLPLGLLDNSSATWTIIELTSEFSNISQNI